MASEQRRLRKRDKALLSGIGGAFSAGLPAYARFVTATEKGNQSFWVVVWDVMFVGLVLAWVAAVILSCYLDDDHPWGSFFVGLGLPGFVLGLGGAFVAFVQ